ncbi:MAG: transposase [bacterium]
MLKVSGAKTAAFAMDMSPAFIAAVKNLPNTMIVFDHFHVVKMLNDKLSALQRELHGNAKDELHKDILKGTRWLLLKNPENLNAKRNERKHLDEVCRSTSILRSPTA